MHKHYILWVYVSQQIDYAFGVSMSRKRNVSYSHFYIVLLFINNDLFYPLEQLIPQSSLDAISRDDQSVLLVPAPLLKHLHACTAMEHSWGSEEYIRHLGFQQRFVKGLYFFKLKHVVSMRKLFLNLFILPIHKQPVKEIGLFNQSWRKINRNVAVCSFPITFQQDRQLLRPAQGKDWNEHLPAFINSLCYQLQHILLSIPFGVPNSSSIGRLCDQKIGGEAWSRSCSQMPISIGIVVTGIYNRKSIILDMIHACTQNMACVVRCDFDAIDLYGLKQSNAFDLSRCVLHFPYAEDIKLLLFLLLACNLSVVFKHKRQEGLSWCRADDRPVISIMLSQIGEGAAVIQMEMRQNNQMDCVVDGGWGCEQF